jgi:sec-independent protein translocase protein TatA
MNMGGLSLWHWLVVGVVVMLLFGKGRFSDMMGDVAKGIKSFKKGMTEEDEPRPASADRPAARAGRRA